MISTVSKTYIISTSEHTLQEFTKRVDYYIERFIIKIFTIIVPFSCVLDVKARNINKRTNCSEVIDDAMTRLDNCLVIY